MSLRIRNLQLDVPGSVHDVEVAFWAAVLDASTRAGDGPYTHLVDPRSPVGVHVQRTGATAVGAHLDLEADDVESEIARLVELGADRTGRGDQGEILLDPAGLPFCVGAWGLVTEQLRPRTGDVVGLEFVVLDVPAASLDATARFWSDALGGVVNRPPPPVDRFRYLSGFAGPGGPFAMLVQDVGASGAAQVHLDLHVDTPDGRDGEVERLVRLGARDAGGAHHWRTLVDPAGLVVDVVPDHRDDAEETP